MAAPHGGSGHNGGPPIDERVSIGEAQQRADVQRRPSYLQRYAGADAPQRSIVGLGSQGCLGRWVLLGCGHWREIRDFDLLPALGRSQPQRARCGLCRERIAPAAADLAEAQRLAPADDRPDLPLFAAAGGQGG